MASSKGNRGPNVIVMRRDPNEVRSLLEALDNNDEYSKSADRKLDRHQYRVKQVRIDLSNKDGSITSFALPTRNISRDGIGLIATQFAYVGTPIIVHLVSLQNHVFPVAGQIVRSRYLASTSGLYEMGVRFDRPIDLALFHRSPPTVRLLVLDADAAAHRAVEQLLKGNLVGMKSLTEGGKLIETATASQHELILVDVDNESLGAVGDIGKLRNSGVWIPCVGVTGALEPQREQELLKAGLSVVVARPISKTVIAGLISSFWRDPLYSALATERDAMPLIEDFVSSMPDRLAEIEATIARENHSGLIRFLKAMVSDAESTGFDFIAHAAREFLKAVEASPTPMVIRKNMNELVAVGRAARGTSCYESN